MNHAVVLVAVISGAAGIALGLAPSAITRLRRRFTRRTR